MESEFFWNVLVLISVDGKKKSWLSYMIEFLDLDLLIYLGSVLWSEICIERSFCVILKVILCFWKSRWVFILVFF